MGIGVGIFLLAVGAILAFGVRDNVSNVDLTVVGYVLMGAGVLGLVLGFAMMRQRANTSHVSVQERRTINEGDPPLPPPAR